MCVCGLKVVISSERKNIFLLKTKLWKTNISYHKYFSMYTFTWSGIYEQNFMRTKQSVYERTFNLSIKNKRVDFDCRVIRTWQHKSESNEARTTK